MVVHGAGETWTNHKASASVTRSVQGKRRRLRSLPTSSNSQTRVAIGFILRPELGKAERLDFDEQLLPEDSWEPDEDEDKYEVEPILDDELPLSTSTTRVQRRFKVKWVGYDDLSRNEVRFTTAGRVWIPLSNDAEVLRLSGELRRKQVNKWFDELGDNQEPYEDESNLHIGVEDKGGRQLFTKLLRVYRQLTAAKGDCPPATSLGTEHHIDTGDAAPIMLKRRR
ncbi:unnamed protein product [Phytophthora fragariaefolia]|uniref:Unnamed protein product n=1 Tax=Phytophthora fragariaefolia TaxID=1490495 RepID=A0A9W6Y570_9STRA|nr:unnamed protein product [Phytophthora fragariaefolia]